MVYKIFLRKSLTVFVFLSSTILALAQTAPTARVTVANSTDATLTIEFAHIERGLVRERVEITIPPLTEKIVIVPAGIVRFVANTYRTSPANRYEEEFTLNNGQVYAMNITPQMFGTSFLADRPGNVGTGITTNTSRVAQNGAAACLGSSWEAGKQWHISGPSGSSPYYETGQYLCREQKTGFFLMGSQYEFYRCSSNFQDCERHAPYDAVVSNRTISAGGNVVYNFKWDDGGRVDQLSEN